jgi:hypothetical protein
LKTCGRKARVVRIPAASPTELINVMGGFVKRGQGECNRAVGIELTPFNHTARLRDGGYGPP